jgi:hypothetical protein
MNTSRTFLSVLFALALIGCAPPAPRPNQTQGATSPSGKYVLRLPIELQTTNPQYKGTRVWKVTITDTSGKVLYRDDSSEMVGNLNVYWGWDSQDRVWVYNSDDGRIWRWELANGGWKKIESEKSDGIPEFVLPDYAKKN